MTGHNDFEGQTDNGDQEQKSPIYQRSVFNLQTNIWLYYFINTSPTDSRFLLVMPHHCNESFKLIDCNDFQSETGWINPISFILRDDKGEELTKYADEPRKLLACIFLPKFKKVCVFIQDTVFEFDLKNYDSPADLKDIDQSNSVVLQSSSPTRMDLRSDVLCASNNWTDAFSQSFRAVNFILFADENHFCLIQRRSTPTSICLGNLSNKTTQHVPLKNTPLENQFIMDAAFVAPHYLAIALGKNPFIYLYDVHQTDFLTKEPLQKIPTHPDVQCLLVWPGGDLLAVSTWHETHVHEFNRGKNLSAPIISCTHTSTSEPVLCGGNLYYAGRHTGIYSLDPLRKTTRIVSDEIPIKLIPSSTGIIFSAASTEGGLRFVPHINFDPLEHEITEVTRFPPGIARLIAHFTGAYGREKHPPELATFRFETELQQIKMQIGELIEKFKSKPANADRKDNDPQSKIQSLVKELDDLYAFISPKNSNFSDKVKQFHEINRFIVPTKQGFLTRVLGRKQNNNVDKFAAERLVLAGLVDRIKKLDELNPAKKNDQRLRG